MESETKAMQISLDRWPIIDVEIVGGQTDSDIEAFIAEAEKLIERGESYFCKLDVQGFSANMAHVKRIATWHKERAPILKGLCQGLAIIIRKEVLRFTFSSFLLLSPMPFEHTVVTDPEEAELWIKEIRLKS